LTRRDLARRCRGLLGALDGPVLVMAPGAPRLAAAMAAALRVAADGECPQGAVVVLLGTRARPAERQATLAALRARLPAGAPLVLIDHNQPRSWWRRLIGVAALLGAGLPPARARYPAARELAALGFTVERLALAGGERVQLVLARCLTGTVA
jgi:hypothetical protein